MKLPNPEHCESTGALILQRSAVVILTYLTTLPLPGLLVSFAAGALLIILIMGIGKAATSHITGRVQQDTMPQWAGANSTDELFTLLVSYVFMHAVLLVILGMTGAVFLSILALVWLALTAKANQKCFSYMYSKLEEK